MRCFFPLRTNHVCCVSGLWLQDWLEVWWDPAARREGPAGHKGEERAGDTAPRDPTAAGDPGSWPGDGCEFKEAMCSYTHTHTLGNTCAYIHTSTYIWTMSVLCIITLLSVCRHVCDKLVQALILSHCHKGHNEITCNIHVPADSYCFLFFPILLLV